MHDKKRKEQIIEAIILAGILLFLVLIFVVNLVYFNYSINADIASDAVLSTLIWNSKEIVPKSWYIANEVRLICTPNVAALIYGLTGNMVLSEGLACCLMTIAILISIFYFCRSLEMNPVNCLLFCFASLILPNSFMSLELLYLFASYYAIHVVILFITLGSYISLLKTEKIIWPQKLICIFLSLILGIQGTRGILIIYGPLFGMECLRQIYHFYCKERKNNYFALGYSICLLLASFIGTCFPVSIGQDMSRNIRKGIPKLFSEVIPDSFGVVGFSEVDLYGKICLIVFLVISVGILLKIVLRMCKRETISSEEWIYLVLCSSPVVTALVVAFTTVESSGRYYFLIFFVMAYGFALAFQKAKGKFKISLAILLIGYTACIFNNVYLPIIRSEKCSQSDMNAVIDYLINNDYQMSYTTFDYANTMTVMSNGELRVAPVASVERMNICKWMSSTEWYVPNVPFESKTAYIISEAKLEEFQDFLKKHEEDVTYRERIGNFFIFTSDYNFSNLGE